MLRILTTNDFYGSYFPHATSYGTLPGAAALVETVERLREGADASLWVDCGDFAQGGPLAPSSAGALGFVAAGQLGIDVATVGNHEFDWGERHVRRWAAEPGFPLVCGNYEVGLPASTVVAAGRWSVGVIGLTHPTLASFHPALDGEQASLGSVVGGEAAELRRQGVDVVVVALHDGVDWGWGADGRLAMRPERLGALFAELREGVDAVLGGHTLGRWVGELGGVPFVQPWAFGSEVGVVDLGPKGNASVSAVAVTGGGAWDGPVRGLYEALAAEVVGELAAPLVSAPMGERSLPQAVADGMLRVTGADVALASAGEFQSMQPPIDGAFAFLPAGPVSEAAVLRVIPWTDDGNVVAEASALEIEALVGMLAEPAGWGSYGPPAVAGRAEGGSAVVALNRWQARRADARLGRETGWTRAGGLRDALRTAVAR